MSLFNLTRNLSLLCFLIAMSIASSVHALSLPNSKRSLARVQYLTNVERLQHGLSPLRPRVLYEPSRVQARNPATSPTPEQYFCIEIRKAEGEKEFVGYLSRTAYSGFSYISIVESKNTCLEVSDVNGGDIVIRSTQANPNYGPYLGSSSIHETGPTVHRPEVFLVQTAQTTGSNVANMANSYQIQVPWSQSTVWTKDIATGKITNKWQTGTGTGLDVTLRHQFGKVYAYLSDYVIADGFEVEFFLVPASTAPAVPVPTME